MLVTFSLPSSSLPPLPPAAAAAALDFDLGSSSNSLVCGSPTCKSPILRNATPSLLSMRFFVNVSNDILNSIRPQSPFPSPPTICCLNRVEKKRYEDRGKKCAHAWYWYEKSEHRMQRKGVPHVLQKKWTKKQVRLTQLTNAMPHDWLA